MHRHKSMDNPIQVLEIVQFLYNKCYIIRISQHRPQQIIFPLLVHYFYFLSTLGSFLECSDDLQPYYMERNAKYIFREMLYNMDAIEFDIRIITFIQRKLLNDGVKAFTNK